MAGYGFSVSGPGAPIPGVYTRPADTPDDEPAPKPVIAAAVPVAEGALRVFAPQFAPGGLVQCESCMRRMLVPGPLGDPHEPLVMVLKMQGDMGEWEIWCKSSWDNVAGELHLWPDDVFKARG